MIRVGVFGAGGRMGAEVCRAVAAAPDMDLVAAVDPALAGRPLAEVAGLPGSDLVIAGDGEALAGGKAEVAVDFTVAASALENVRWCLGHGVHAVVGTTGISPDDLESVLEPSGGEGHVFFAPWLAKTCPRSLQPRPEIKYRPDPVRTVILRTIERLRRSRKE
ncbi:MAG: hypothetical protein E6G66_17970 [Actinobacteria bacterium]|nr:MAG: hypothetical protein E6G66_17970 [Actinomycetota bacterium]